MYSGIADEGCLILSFVDKMLSMVPFLDYSAEELPAESHMTATASNLQIGSCICCGEEVQPWPTPGRSGESGVGAATAEASSSLDRGRASQLTQAPRGVSRVWTGLQRIPHSHTRWVSLVGKGGPASEILSHGLTLVRCFLADQLRTMVCAEVAFRAVPRSGRWGCRVLRVPRDTLHFCKGRIPSRHRCFISPLPEKQPKNEIGAIQTSEDTFQW